MLVLSNSAELKVADVAPNWADCPKIESSVRIMWDFSKHGGLFLDNFDAREIMDASPNQGPLQRDGLLQKQDAHSGSGVASSVRVRSQHPKAFHIPKSGTKVHMSVQLYGCIIKRTRNTCVANLNMAVDASAMHATADYKACLVFTLTWLPNPETHTT